MAEASPDRPAVVRFGPFTLDLRAGELAREGAAAASAYRVLAKLGAGNMGEVYRAEDLVLKRQVALKVLPAAVAGDPDRLARFRREAEVLASLNHPHICTLHAIGEALPEDLGIAASPAAAEPVARPFLVMEHIDGQTLAARLEKGPLPPTLVCEVGAQIADALAAAHRHGVVHRDLKPANIMLTRTGAGRSGVPHVKLLDFGLAKLAGHGEQPAIAFDSAAETHGAGLTGQGTVLGTLPYMAPEQVEGHDADTRTDIWALGTVLYEMATGKPAFAADSSAGLAGRILTAEPSPMQVHQPLTPPALDRVVQRCLAKSPDDRWASAHDLAEQLRWIAQDGGTAASAQGGAGPPRRWRRRAAWGVGLAGVLSVALFAGVRFGLPRLAPRASSAEKPAVHSGTSNPRHQIVAVALFGNYTGDPDLDVVGLMAADWITDGLTQVAGAEVALPPSSALGAAGAADTEARDAYRDPRKVGEATGATIVVSGEYHVEGDAIVFRARVSEPATGRLMATIAPASGPVGQPLKAVDEVRRAVVAAVAFHLDSNFALRGGRVPSIEAYRAMAEAMTWWYRDWDAVIRHLERAVAADPDYSSPRVHLAMASIARGDFERAQREIDDVARLEAGLTEFEQLEIRYVRAHLTGQTWEYLAAAREQARLAPGAHFSGGGSYDAAVMLYALNRPSEACALLHDLAGRPGTIGWAIPEIRSHALHLAGRYDEQLEVAARAREQYPRMLYFHEHQAAALAAMGNSAGVGRVVDDTLAAQAESGTPGLVMLVAAMELRAHGHRPQADAMAERAARWYGEQPPEKFVSLQTPNRGVEWYRSRPSDITKRLREEQAMALQWAGHWDEARALVEALRAADPDNVDYLGWHGVLAARRGDQREARLIAEGLRTVKRKYLFGSDLYWRACIAAHLGAPQEAVDLLTQAFSEGYWIQTQLHRTIDLEPLWTFVPFKEVLRPKG